MEKLTCSIPEMAEILGISKSRAYPLARSAGFPAITIGKRVVISIKGLQEWVDKQAGAKDAVM